MVEVFKAWDKSKQTKQLIQALKDVKTAADPKTEAGPSEQQFTVALAALSKGGKRSQRV